MIPEQDRSRVAGEVERLTALNRGYPIPVSHRSVLIETFIEHFDSIDLVTRCVDELLDDENAEVPRPGQLKRWIGSYRAQRLLEQDCDACDGTHFVFVPAEYRGKPVEAVAPCPVCRPTSAPKPTATATGNRQLETGN